MEIHERSHGVPFGPGPPAKQLPPAALTKRSTPPVSRQICVYNLGQWSNGPAPQTMTDSPLRYQTRCSAVGYVYIQEWCLGVVVAAGRCALCCTRRKSGRKEKE